MAPTAPPAAAAAAVDVEKPALLLAGDPRLAVARAASPSSSSSASSALLGRPRSALRRGAGGRRIGEDADEDLEYGGAHAPETKEERQRRMEEEVFDDRPLVQINRVVRIPGAMQMQREQQVYGRTNVSAHIPAHTHRAQ